MQTKKIGVRNGNYLKFEVYKCFHRKSKIMPKYIRKRPGPKVIQGIEHKYCWTCSTPQWKPLDQFGKRGNGKYSNCKACRNMKNKQRRKVIKEKRKKAREAAAPTGFLVCLFAGCTVKDWLQPVNQFASPFVRNDKPTKNCLTCRDNNKEKDKQRYAACGKVYQNWRKTHPCVKCMNNPKYEHNYLVIEADHLGGKVKECSNMSYWCHSQRGPAALRAELMTVQALCKFHHALQTQQRNHVNGKIEKRKDRLRKRTVINKEKHKRGCCLLCKRPVKEGEECAFHFDHRDASTKFEYNGKVKNPSQFVNLSDALFDTQWPLEQAKCDLLCANCDKLKTCASRDGYKK